MLTPMFPETVSRIRQPEKPKWRVEYAVRIISHAVRLTIEIGVTSLVTEGFATAIPPTALVTDTAGVKTPSANVRLVPKRLCDMPLDQRRVFQEVDITRTSSGHQNPWESFVDDSELFFL